MIKIYVLSLLCVVIVMLPLDLIWLKSSYNVYVSQIGTMLLEKPRFSAAGVFYIIYAIGVTYFAVVPSLGSHTFITAAARGALLGLVAYGTYDASNYATLKDYTATIMIVDWAWGTVLTATTAAIAWKLVQLIR